jgi:hypothetical protein
MPGEANRWLKTWKRNKQMRISGTTNRQGHIVRGADAIAAVQADVKYRAILAARANYVVAQERKNVLGDVAGVTRAEDQLDYVHVECFGRLPNTLRHRPPLTEMQLRKRTAEARLKREQQKFDANKARRKRAAVGRIVNAARPPLFAEAEDISLDQLIAMCRDKGIH